MKLSAAISIVIVSLTPVTPAPLFSQSSPDTQATGDSATSLKLLDREPDPNAPDANGTTPLMTACRWGNIPVVQALLSKGARVDTPRSPGGRTPLMIGCAYYSGVAICQLLVTHGADVNATANDGSTPLMLAAESAKVTVVEYLLANGADPDRRDKNGKTALDYARTADTGMLGNGNGTDNVLDKAKVVDRLEKLMKR